MLDRPKARSYYAACVLTCAALLGVLTGCVRGPASIAPSGLTALSRDTLAGWLAAYVPASPRRFELRWRFLTPRGSTAGRAAVRVTPPDSLRFDYRGPFGRSGAAVLVGDSALWAEPEKETRDLIPLAPLFWAALGMPLAPPTQARVFGRGNGLGRAWRYVLESDTLDLVEVGNGPERLLTELRRDRILATTDLKFQPGSRVPLEGQMRFPTEGTLFTFTVVGIDSTETFDPAIWRRP